MEDQSEWPWDICPLKDMEQVQWEVDFIMENKVDFTIKHKSLLEKEHLLFLLLK